MGATGFVLAGGQSTRMGRDKALLPYRGTTLVEHVATLLSEAVPAVAVIGDPSRYAWLPYPVYPDQVPACGPIGGIYTALSVTATDWNLVVACDMPVLSAAVLRCLLERGLQSGAPVVAAIGPGGGLEPLCAAYHRRSLPLLDRAIRSARFRMKDVILELGTEGLAVDSAMLANVNTPEEWLVFRDTPA